MSSLFGIGGGGNVGASGSFYPYLIDQSLRFEESGAANLTFTPSNNGTDNKKFTYSVWIKRGQQSADDQHLIQSKNTGGGTGQGHVGFILDTSDSLDVYTQNGGVNSTGTRLLRDHSGWYHFCFVYDTTEATASDRVKVYINGDRDTLSGSFPPLNSVMSSMNYNGQEQYIGKYVAGFTRYFNGYMAEIHMVDGQALSPTDFAEEVNGIWVPKEYTDNGTISHGVNGYHLDFADSSAIGNDVSGNNNDWTANNLAASDVMSGESPTNNFAVFNPLDRSGTTLTYSEGNLKAENTSSGFAQAYSSFSFDSGKWYAEFLLDTGNSGVGVIAGTTNAGANRYLGQDSFTYSYYFDGRKVNNATYTAYGDSYTTAADGSGDVVGVYIDADNGDIYFSKNGTVQNSGTAAFTGVTGPFRFAIASESNAFHIANFGQDDSFAGLKTSGSAAASDDNGNGVFYDTIGLSGYLAPCSANLPEPTISPNAEAQADDYFNTVLYTGNGSTQSITGVGFQPDWVWIKQRNGTRNNVLYDSVRGATERLISNTTDAEATAATALTSFDADGFSLGNGTTSNENSKTYVSWNWKAGGTAVSNTDGSITSSVSAAPDAGFSICTYTGTATVSESFGHGLNQAPELVITKARNSTNDWRVHGSVLGTHKFLSLSNSNGVATDSSNGGFPDNTDTLVNLGYESTNGTNYVAYCFHSVDGFSKVGSYVGNGSTDGTFVYTGFRPAWVMVKEIGASGFWMIQDNKIYPFNDGDTRSLAANDTGSETTISNRGNEMDILSNGFKMRASTGDFNASNTHIYLAFAEAPFKYSLAR